MKLKEIYQKIIEEGIKADIRKEEEIKLILKEQKKIYENIKDKETFDTDSLFNPFSDTRVLYGDLNSEIKSIIVGIDVDVAEILFVDMLKKSNTDIDLVMSHHPAGKAYANFYEVMDLQIDMLVKEGISVSVAESLLSERKAEIERKVSAANHNRVVDIAKWLKINFLCAHTPADNLAYRYIKNIIEKRKPYKLKDIIDILLEIPEYKYASTYNNPPKIVLGNKDSKVSKIHIEFTGGTEGPIDIYKKLADSGVDTIIAMHQSEEHFKRCKEERINVIFASHIASDTLGVNLLLDVLEKKEKLKIYEFSGFRRFRHN